MQAAESLLGESARDQLVASSISSLFDQVCDPATGTLSYAQLRMGLERPPIMSSPSKQSSPPRSSPPRGRSGPRSPPASSHPLSGTNPSATGASPRRVVDIFEGAGPLIDRQAFRLAMLRLGLRAAPQEIDALFDAVDVTSSGAVERESLLHLLRSGRLMGGGVGAAGDASAAAASVPRLGTNLRGGQHEPSQQQMQQQQQQQDSGISDEEPHHVARRLARPPHVEGRLPRPTTSSQCRDELCAEAAASRGRRRRRRTRRGGRAARRGKCSDPTRPPPRGGRSSPRCGGVWNQQPQAANANPGWRRRRRRRRHARPLHRELRMPSPRGERGRMRDGGAEKKGGKAEEEEEEEEAGRAGAHPSPAPLGSRPPPPHRVSCHWPARPGLWIPSTTGRRTVLWLADAPTGGGSTSSPEQPAGAAHVAECHASRSVAQEAPPTGGGARWSR